MMIVCCNIGLTRHKTDSMANAVLETTTYRPAPKQASMQPRASPIADRILPTSCTSNLKAQVPEVTREDACANAEEEAGAWSGLVEEGLGLGIGLRKDLRTRIQENSPLFPPSSSPFAI